MLYELPPHDYEKVRSLFQPLDDHLAVGALLDGATPGQVYVDDLSHPDAALARVKYRFHLAGSPANEGFNRSLRLLMVDTIYPQALAAGEVMYTLYYAPTAWAEVVDVILRDKYPLKTQRQYYERKSFDSGWRPQPPAGYSRRAVDAALLADTTLKNSDALKEEMCSERPTVQEFLAKSFGVCLLHGDEIAGWCLSEYNCANRCEVGIETVEAHQRRGLGTLMACALAEEAYARGVTRIGWHCYARNVASASTALKAGFEHVCDYPAYFAWFNPVDNLAVHGNICFGQQQVEEALDWYRRAFALGEARSWAYWNAAQAAGAQGDHPTAMRYLSQAVDTGFDDLEQLTNAGHLRSLHDTPGWRELIARLQKQAEAGS